MFHERIIHSVAPEYGQRLGDIGEHLDPHQPTFTRYVLSATSSLGTHRFQRVPNWCPSTQDRQPAQLPLGREPGQKRYDTCRRRSDPISASAILPNWRTSLAESAEHDSTRICARVDLGRDEHVERARRLEHALLVLDLLNLIHLKVPALKIEPADAQLSAPS